MMDNQEDHSPSKLEVVGKSFSPIDLAPPQGSPVEESAVFVACFRVFFVPQEQLMQDLHQIDILATRLTFIYGTPAYLDPGRLIIRPGVSGEPLVFEAAVGGHKEAPLGCYALVGTHYPSRPEPSDESYARERVERTVALARLLLGRNAAFDQVFEQIVHGDGKVTAATPGIEAPPAFGAPNLSVLTLNDLEAAGRAIQDMNEEDRNRTELAIRWVGEAITSSGVDSFLKYWVALETLAMKDTTNIGPLNENLGKAYGVSAPDAKAKFQIGRLFGLRSDIVHGGKRPPTHTLDRYLQALFVDMLRHALRLPLLRKAGGLLDEPGFDLDAHLAAM